MRVENEKSFIILAGSQSMGQWDGAGSQKAAMDKQYHFLKNQQILQKDGESWIFIKDYICASPSLAAQLIAGSIRGGWLTWQCEKTGALLDRWRHEIKKTCNKGENKSYS